MPRKYADMHVIFNGIQADSVKFLPKDIKRSRNFEIRCDPGMWVKFTPFGATIGRQTTYVTGIELKVMMEVAEKIEKYIRGRDRSILNQCELI